LLAEALTTHGITLARLDHFEQAQTALDRAVEIAEKAGDFQSAGVAALSLIEHLGANLSDEGVRATIDHVGILLETTRDTTVLRRLVKAFQSLLMDRTMPVLHDWNNFSFRQSILQYEANLIIRALDETGGKVTAAARLLGFNHHQSLIALIESRHKELLAKRSPIRKRRQHLMPHPKRKPRIDTA